MKSLNRVWFVALAISMLACNPIKKGEVVPNFEVAPNALNRPIDELPFPANQVKIGMSHANALLLLEGNFERSFNPRTMELGAWCEGYTIDYENSQEFLQINFVDDKVARINVVDSNACVIF